MGAKPGTLENDSMNQGGAWAAPGGVVYGRDGQVIREMIATVSLLGGDAVIFDVSLPPFNVNKTSISDNPLRYGVVTGAQIGVQAAAASAPVWVVVEGPVWANGSSAISVGDQVGTTSLVAGHVWKSGVGGLTGKYVVALPATVSFAASVASIGANAYLDVKFSATGKVAGDVPIAFTPTTSLGQGVGIGQLWASNTTSVGIRFTNVTSVAWASQASIQGTLTVARGTSLGVGGAILGRALTSTGAAASTPVQIFLAKD